MIVNILINTCIYFESEVFLIVISHNMNLALLKCFNFRGKYNSKLHKYTLVITYLLLFCG